MNKLKRYTVEAKHVADSTIGIESPTGEYVLYSDVSAIEIAASENALTLIGSMQRRIDELEALSQQAHIAALMSESEWEALTPQSRHRINVFAQDAASLAGLVRDYVTSPRWMIETQGDALREILRLAHLLVSVAPSIERTEFTVNIATIDGVIPGVKAVAWRLEEGASAETSSIIPDVP